MISYNLINIFLLKLKQKNQVNKKRKNHDLEGELAVVTESTKRVRKGNTATNSASLASLMTILPKVCQHENNHEYVTRGERGYFTASYYAKRPDCTRICVSCKGEFGTTIKICDKTPAYCCRNQFDKHNPCPHAYCHSCWNLYR
jgi:hypothetical protein